ncbi:hypothetical protein EPN44_13370 [bacterium]|nr:MAG: hypothetical protein EPN44_13370 [bacterium]
MPEGTIPHLDEIVRLAAPGEPFVVSLVGRSMHPALREGDQLVVDPPGGRPRLGDVIVFPYAGRMLAHRVIGCGADGILAAGDASTGQRERVRFERVVGVVRAARRNGRPLWRPSSRMRALFLRLRLAVVYRMRMGRPA